MTELEELRDALYEWNDIYLTEVEKQQVRNAADRILEVPDTADKRIAELEAADPTPDDGLIEVGKMTDTLDAYPNINRVEVIDSKGRAYTKYNAADVRISFQDQGQTLKVFLLDGDAGKVEET
jgi:hypothetical protein